MPNDPLYDEISATTYQEIYPRVIEDLFFLDTPLLAYLRHHCLKEFAGGSAMQQTFRYTHENGGFYAMGDNFNLDKKPTLGNTVFDPRFAETNITLYKEEIQVLNTGTEAFFSLLDEHMSNAMQTMNVIIALGMQAFGTGARSKAINGWD
ncbi:MAG: hypothetical protein ACRD22_09890, partial [Terriglobia bacterium]